MQNKFKFGLHSSGTFLAILSYISVLIFEYKEYHFS